MIHESKNWEQKYKLSQVTKLLMFSVVQLYVICSNMYVQEQSKRLEAVNARLKKTLNESSPRINV